MINTSAINYQGNTIYCKDDDLEEWVLGLSTTVNDLKHVGQDVDWLVDAYEDWNHIIQNFPEGYKHINFEDFLETPQDVQEFVQVLEHLQALEYGLGFDLIVAKEVTAKVLNKLFA